MIKNILDLGSNSNPGAVLGETTFTGAEILSVNIAYFIYLIWNIGLIFP